MDGRLVTTASSKPGSSVTGASSDSVPLRAQILDVINHNHNERKNTDQDIKAVFVEKIWPRVEDGYQKMASNLAKACTTELSDRSVPIQAVVEDRVKSRRSIEKSLQRREIHREKEGLGTYKDIHTILEDLHDLVGIRIIVEYLDHLEAVSEIVTGTFHKEKEPNVFSADRKVGHSWPSWFGAYECTNYHISAKFDEENPLSFYNGIVFEIQVTSLPANMYNKIAHPLLYKEEAGPLSQGDEIVVDLTKGLAYCYSLCLYFKRYKLGGDVVEPSDIELLRNISSTSGELDQSSINTLAGKIPGLDVAAARTKNVPRESLGLVLEGLLNDQMPDDIGQVLLDRFSREIQDIGQPQINLPTSGDARFDSQDVSSSPVCQEGTQTRAIRYIHDWIDEGDTPLLWVHSHAGTGKSTLARTIAKELTETGRIAAGYFFKRGVANRNGVSRIFPTIASQFMSTIPRYEAFLRKSVMACKNPDIETMRLDEQFRVLIEVPLSEVGSISSTKVIIIDALDECTDLSEASKIVSLLCSLTNLSLLRFRLLVTGRNEPLAQRAIENQIHTSLSLASTFQDDNKSDISSILRLGFEDIRKEGRIKDTWPTEEKFNVVLQRSVDPSPLFIYAATLLRFLRKGAQIRSPQKRLEMWIERSAGTTDKSQLEVMYTAVFENLDRDMEDGDSGLLMDEEKNDLRTILGTIVLAAEPLSIEAIAAISKLDSETTQGLLTLCRAVLEISDDNKQPVRTVHKSFSDFLLRKPRRETLWFHVDEMVLHDHIAEGCMCLVLNLRKDICEINDPGVDRVDIESETIESYIPKSLQYACSYWWHHLRSGSKQALSSEALAVLLKTHLLHWIECLAILDRLPYVSNTIRGLCASIIEYPSQSVRTLVPFLKDASRFILRHGDTIRENPLQIYGTALVFSPKESIIRRHFWEIRNPGVRVIRSMESRWDACLKEINDLERVCSMSVSPDGQKLAVAGYVPGTRSKFIGILHTGAGTVLSKLNLGTSLRALTWSNDGNYVLSITRFGEVMRHDPKLETTNPIGYSPYLADKGYRYAAICSRGTASVARVLSDEDSGKYIKSEIFTWNFLRPNHTFHSLEIAESMALDLFLSPDGTLLAMCVEAWFPDGFTSTVKVVQVNTGACIHELPVYARSLAFSPDGCRLFIYPSNIKGLALTVLKLPSGCFEDITVPEDFAANYMAILPDYTTIITAGARTIKFWDLEASRAIVGSPLRSDPQHLDDGCLIDRVAISPSGRFMVTSSDDKHGLNLWRLPQGSFERTLEVDLSMDTGVWSFFPVCDMSVEAEIFVLSLDNAVHIWFLGGTGNKGIKGPDAFNLPMGDLCLNSVRGSEGPSRHRFNVSLSNGRMTAVSFNDSLEISELGAAPKLRFESKTPGGQVIEAIGLSPNSKYLAISYGTTIRIWNLADTSTYDELQTHNKVNSLVFSPDESLLVYETDKSIWEWAMMPSQDAKCLCLLDQYFKSRYKPCFLLSGKILACLVASLYDGETRVLLWDTSSGLRLPDFKVSDGAVSLSFSENDRILCDWGYLSILDTYEFEPAISQLEQVSKLASNHHVRIDVTYEWIYRNTQRFLKIPVEYAVQNKEYGSNYLSFSRLARGVIILDLH